MLTGEFCIHYVLNGLHFDAVPWFGTDYSTVVGAVIFNMAFVVTVPSWLNEKKPKVSVNKSMWYSTIARYTPTFLPTFLPTYLSPYLSAASWGS